MTIMMIMMIRRRGRGAVMVLLMMVLITVLATAPPCSSPPSSVCSGDDNLTSNHATDRGSVCSCCRVPNAASGIVLPLFAFCVVVVPGQLMQPVNAGDLIAEYLGEIIDRKVSEWGSACT